MPVALVHYHLRLGGVTRVLEAQSRALRETGVEHVILSGTPYQGSADLPVVVVPELDYRDEQDSGSATGSSLCEALREVAAAALGRAPEIWHLHNPTLGKNILLPALLEDFGRSRDRLVLQFHDLAEDGRAGNYRLLSAQREIYPVAPQIHYTFINSRDRDLLIQAGVPAEQTSLLPNAVVPPSAPPSPELDSSAPRTVLYPVRGIRRKNLGEFCLLSALAPDDATFALTLAPENPNWRAVYDQWVRFARHHDLRAQFGVVGSQEPAPGVKPTFENWLGHATHLLTTSVAEGFGLAFLEPIGLGKPLLGRDLPDITADFKQHDLALGNLYEEVLIPRDWIDQEALSDQLEAQLRANYLSYDVPLSSEALEAARDSLLRGDHADFGNLPEAQQEAAIVHALASPEDVLISRPAGRSPARDWLQDALVNTAPSSPPSSLKNYALARYSDLLAEVYRGLRSTTTASPKWLDKSRVLEQFLHPERFHFLRT